MTEADLRQHLTEAEMPERDEFQDMFVTYYLTYHPEVWAAIVKAAYRKALGLQTPTNSQ